MDIHKRKKDKGICIQWMYVWSADDIYYDDEEEQMETNVDNWFSTLEDNALKAFQQMSDIATSVSKLDGKINITGVKIKPCCPVMPGMRDTGQILVTFTVSKKEESKEKE